MRAPRVVVAGTASGAGKTTVAAGVMAALARRGLRVAPFKVGPDYIDPGWHRLAAGRPGRNLDLWLLGEETVHHLFARAAAGAGVAVIEGVMGLFDGRGGGDEASTAHVARVLRAPVVLVVDAARAGRSVAAVVRGFLGFDRRVRVAGVVLNRVSGPEHGRLAREAVEAACRVPVLGCLPRAEGVTVPERHLGLVPAAEAGGARAGEGRGRAAVGGPAAAGGGGGDAVARLAALVEEHLDLDRLLALAGEAPEVPERWLRPPREAAAILGGAPAAPDPACPADAVAGRGAAGAGGRGGLRVRLAVARDEAFHFYYEDSLELLEAAGAELVPFSPLRDEGLPPCDGVVLGGGFPEVFAAELAANRPLLDDLRRQAAAGLPVYAECGGLLLLCRELVDGDGRAHRLAGVIPARAIMGRRLAGFGYREAEAAADSLLLSAGERVRGHEFHYARLEPDGRDVGSDGWRTAYVLRGSRDAAGAGEGWVRGRTLASFLHLHFWSRPELAVRLVERCRALPAAAAGSGRAAAAAGGPRGGLARKGGEG